MTLPRIISRNTIQTIPEKSLKGNSNVIGTTFVTLYTVPSNQKAVIIKAGARFISGGANTNLRLNIGGERMYNQTVADTQMVDIPAASGQALDAGDTITLSGDSGSDNGSMNYYITYKELPI